MQVKSVRDAEIKGKRVLVRCDFDVPVKDGKVLDDTRIQAVIPTIELLHANGASNVILLAHCGRPGGKIVEVLRIAPVEARLRELTSVPFTLLENLRFDPREEQNDEAFAQELAMRGDIFVNEAFADSHRKHTSIVGVARLLPPYAGLRLEEEIENLSKSLTPPRNSLAIIGGAKFETKQPLIEKLLGLYGALLLGGALGNDVTKARGLPVGVSRVSGIPVPVTIAGEERLKVPLDAVVSEPGTNAERAALTNDIRGVEAIVDIGPATAALWGEEIQRAPFVLWNGPMGVYEQGYTRGTDALAAALAASTTPAVIGGGDTIAAISKYSFDRSKVFLSTGGGAMLEFLVNGTLPGIEVLKS